MSTLFRMAPMTWGLTFRRFCRQRRIISRSLSLCFTTKTTMSTMEARMTESVNEGTGGEDHPVVARPEVLEDVAEPIAPEQLRRVRRDRSAGQGEEVWSLRGLQVAVDRLPGLAREVVGQAVVA